MKRKKVLLRTLLVGLMLWLPLDAPVPLYAQSGDTPPESTRGGETFRFEHLTPEEGLPSLTVRSMVQDQQGFMWFATGSGLSRYDGYTFKTFRNDPHDPHSISTESFGRLYVDRQGVLWVGTWNGGLNVFDRTTEQFTHYLHDPDDSNSLSHNRVNVILEDKSGRLWIGTEGGLNRFDPASKQFFRYQHDPNDPHSLSSNIVKAMVEDASGQLWVGTFGGVNKFDPASGQFTRYQNDPQDPNSLIYDNVEALASEATGSLWIGTKAGLDYFDPLTEQFIHYRHDPADPQSLSGDDIAELYLDASGDMWIGTSGGGVNIFDPQTKTFTQVPYDSSDPYGFHGDWVSTIYADRSGALWIATLGKGVNRLDRAAAKFELYQHNPDDPDSLSPGSIWSILQDRSGALWVASVSGGLNKLDPVTGHFQHYRHDPADPHSLSNDSIFAMTEDATGTLWVGTIGGLNRFDRASEQFTRYIHDPANPASLSENWVAGLYADRSGRLWVGTIGKGLDLYDPDTDSFRHYQADPENPHSLLDNNVLTFVEDSSSQLWIGTISGGLNKFDPETGTFTRYLHDPDNLNSLINDNVSHIYLDPAGVLWLATPAGLDKFDPQTETFTHYTEQHGLASKALASVVGDAQGNLWVGMQGSGLACFDPRSETFKNYDTSDGLQSNDFMPRAAYRDADGKLYFGGLNGLNAFYPDQLRDNPYVPPVVLTDFQIFNHPVTIGGEDSPLQQVINEADEITLSYQQSVFSFEFAALNYRAPKKNQYAYKLEGFDQDWNYVDSTRRFATYTNLGPGTYTFWVKASNNDGVWNEAGKSIKITIAPSWWQTWWFYALCVASVLGIFGVIYQAKANQLKAEKQTALVLRESEAHYRELADSITDVFFALDNQLHCTYWNKASERLTGVPAHEAVGKSLYELFPDTSEIRRAERVYREVLRTQQPQTFVNEYRPGEKNVVFEITAYPSRDGIAVFAKDITERRQIEKARRESEARYRAVIESQVDLISRYLPDTTLTFVNDAYCQFYGKTHEELIGHSYLFMIASEFRELVRQETEELAENPRPLVGEYVNYRHDGKERWIQWVIQCIADENGQVVELQAVGRDITERKQAEQALEESEERLRLALEATADGIWDWDPRTGQAYFSPRYYTMMGYDPGEFPPTYESWRQLLHPDDMEASEEAVQRALEEHTPFAIEFRFKAKDGDWRWILGRGKTAELDEEGKAIRVAGSHTDITARKQAEDEIRWLNEELEQRVVERTAQLEVANQELEAFAYSVSHDLRAPLRHIVGFIQLLHQREEERLDATSSRYLNVIVESVDRMGQLIDDLLAFSRTGRAEMQVQQLDLEGLIREVQQELAPEMEGRHITWEIGSLPSVQADPALLRQVWVNLLSNAIKFTAPRPKARIEIGTVQGKSGSSEVTLFVQDNGVGFDSQYAHKLFGVFQRLHGKEEFEGTGIGLATVRRIVERHGGRVWAEGDLDHGAAFYLTLRQAKRK